LIENNIAAEYLFEKKETFYMKRLSFLSALLMSVVVAYGMEPAHSTRSSEFGQIRLALAVGDWQEIADILAVTPSLVNTYETSRGETLLYRAVAMDSFNLAKILLEKYGADPNGAGGNILWIAMVRGNIPMIKLLLEYGADPDMPNQATGISLRRLVLGQKDPMFRDFDVLETIESFDKK